MTDQFQAGFDERRAKGGARPGAGRKPSPKTILRRLALCELDIEVERSLAFIVHVRNNSKVGWPVRLEAAKEIMNRRLGRPKQAVSLLGDENKQQFVVVTNYSDCGCMKTPDGKCTPKENGLPDDGPTI